MIMTRAARRIADIADFGRDPFDNDEPTVIDAVIAYHNTTPEDIEDRLIAQAW